MHRPKPNKLHDELDALLDGRPVELTDELAPLAEAADALRAELAAYRLDPTVADRHLERVLDGSATVVQMPVRRQATSWDMRRRAVAVALAAALVLAPATMASAAALPGQAMYPFKLAIEQLRLASVQWSPSREAGERTKIADERLDEVQSLVRLKLFHQLPGALNALSRAVIAARAAVSQAQREGEAVSTVAAHLYEVEGDRAQVLEKVATVADPSLLPGTRKAIQDAVRESRVVLPPPADEGAPGQGTSTPTTSAVRDNPPSEPTSPPTTGPPTTGPPTTGPPTTGPPTTDPPTTDPPTTDPPTTATPDSPGGESDGAGGATGAGGWTPDGVPPTTLGSP